MQKWNKSEIIKQELWKEKEEGLGEYEKKIQSGLMEDARNNVEIVNDNELFILNFVHKIAFVFFCFLKS